MSLLTEPELAELRVLTESFGPTADDVFRLLDHIDGLTELARELAEALDRITDDEPCRLDHHGYCQEHSLTAPCHTAIAISILAQARAAGLLDSDTEAER